MGVVYAEDCFQIESKVEHVNPYGRGSDGYGRKIATQYKVRLDGFGPWRRVYATCFSNCASHWVVVRGKAYNLRSL
jgi:hypothetical protein